MSEYLGFDPSRNPIYYFVSYNSGDKDLVGKITKAMVHRGINLWYDFGIDYGEEWENVITRKIRDSQGVLLFFTKGILIKRNSYVQKEYKIAKFLNQKIYVALCDVVTPEDVPIDKIAWWIDINDNQTINLFDSNDIDKVIEKLALLLGVQTYEDQMDQIISIYNSLYFSGRIKEAETVLVEYLRKITLKGKVELISNIVIGGFFKTNILSTAENCKKLKSPLVTHTGEKRNDFFECKQVCIENDNFIVGNGFVFHRGNRGDAHVIWIWKNGELIHTIGGLIESRKLEIYWDSIDNIIYITYYSDKEYMEEKDVITNSFLSITSIEDPNGMAICTNFSFIKSID